MHQVEPLVASASASHILQYGPFEIDLKAERVRSEADGTTVHLTLLEWNILRMLVEHIGQPVATAVLARALYEPSYPLKDAAHSLRTHVSNLRRKLEHDPDQPLIRTVPGQGYLIRLDEPSRLVRVSSPGSASLLPVPLTPCLGREADLEVLQRLLLRPEVRVLTLHGPGGVGKTHLGLHLAAQVQDAFSGGAWFVDLSALTDPRLVLPSILSSLHIPDDNRPPLLLLSSYLRQHRTLLILDTFEHVRGAAADLQQLLMACPHLTLLTTSRVPLQLPGEYEYQLAPLALPDGHCSLEVCARSPAVQLLVARLQALDPSFALTADNAACIGTICSQLDGLPLALELAAALYRVLSLKEVAERLDRRLDVLTLGAPYLPARQQTLRRSLEWSFQLLSLLEQLLLGRLGLGVGGFTLEAPCVLGDDAAGPIERGIATLLLHNWLQCRRGAHTEPRFTMLATAREFAQEYLATKADAPLVAARYTHYYAALATRLLDQAEPPSAAVLAQLEDEHDNLRVVLGWLRERAPAQMALLVSRLWTFWYAQGYVSEGRGWVEEALQVADPVVGAAERARLLMGRSMLDQA